MLLKVPLPRPTMRGNLREQIITFPSAEESDFVNNQLDKIIFSKQDDFGILRFGWEIVNETKVYKNQGINIHDEPKISLLKYVLRFMQF